MSPKQSTLTSEQLAVVHELQAEIHALGVAADSKWAQYVKTGDVDCYNEVIALDGEIELKGLIAYFPKAGDKRVGRAKKLIDRMRMMAGESVLGDMIGVSGGNYSKRADGLDAVNAWREEFGLPLLDRLPPGIVGDSNDCTLARAFQIGWDKSDTWELEEVNIGGSGRDDNTLLLTNKKTGELMSVNLNDGYFGSKYVGVNTSSWNSIISDFDAGYFVDLLEDDALAGAIEEMIDDGYDTEGIQPSEKLDLALAEAERRGLSLMVHDRLEFVDGRYVVAPFTGDEYASERDENDA